MATPYHHTLLLVDDETSILRALKRLFRREGHTILTAESGRQALDLLGQTQQPVSLIISDQRMPGMNGAVFLEQSMAPCPDAVRFLLTGYSDMNAVVDAVNKGKIHKYLTKPWDDADLLAMTREALAQVELKWENRRLTELTRRQNKELARLNSSLEETVSERTWALKFQNKMLQRMNSSLEDSLMASIRLLLSLVESSNPRLGGYMKAVGKLARQVAVAAGLDEEAQNRLEMAGLVHDIGLIGIPDDVVGKGERMMSPEEFSAYAHHPQIASVSLSSVEGFNAIGEIVGAHHENLDGTGFPNQLQGEALSTEVRILSIAADYCTVVHLWPGHVKRLLAVARRYAAADTLSDLELTGEGAMREWVAEKVILSGVGQRYDGAMVEHFLNCIGSDPVGHALNHLAFNLLQTGMVLTEDLRLKDGRLLLTRGTELNDGALKSIQTIGLRGMIQGTIPVTLPSSLSGEERVSS